MCSIVFCTLLVWFHLDEMLSWLKCNMRSLLWSIKSRDHVLFFVIFWHTNPIHFQRGISAVPLFFPAFCARRHIPPNVCGRLPTYPVRRRWLRLQLEMYWHIIRLKHTSLSNEKMRVKRKKEKAVWRVEAVEVGCNCFYRVVTKEKSMPLPFLFFFSLPLPFHQRHSICVCVWLCVPYIWG